METADDLGLGWPTALRAERVLEATERTWLEWSRFLGVLWSSEKRRISLSPLGSLSGFFG